MTDEETVAREASVIFSGTKRDPACTCPKFLCRGDDGVLKWKPYHAGVSHVVSPIRPFPYATARSCRLHSDTPECPLYKAALARLLEHVKR